MSYLYNAAWYSTVHFISKIHLVDVTSLYTQFKDQIATLTASRTLMSTSTIVLGALTTVSNKKIFNFPKQKCSFYKIFDFTKISYK